MIWPHLALLCSFSVSHSEVPLNQIYELRALRTPFNVRGAQLFAVTTLQDHYLLRNLANRTLAMASGHGLTLVSSFSQLFGRVSLTSPEEALAYVRLQNSPVFTVPGQVRRFEVVEPADHVSSFHFGFPVPNYIVGQKLRYEWQHGVIEPNTRRMLGLRHPVARRVGDRFVVERTLWELRDKRVTEVVEEVLPDGQYKLLSSKGKAIPAHVQTAL